jgi:hypothetical protein
MMQPEPVVGQPLGVPRTVLVSGAVPLAGDWTITLNVYEEPAGISTVVFNAPVTTAFDEHDGDVHCQLTGVPRPTLSVIVIPRAGLPEALGLLTVTV